MDTPPPASGGDESAGGSRRRLLILGAVAGIIVLAAAAYLLLHKGSSSPTASPVPTVVQTAPAAGGGSKAKTTGHKPTSLPKVAKHTSPRDPFQALVNPPVQTSGAPASSTTVSAAPSVSTAPSTGSSPVVVTSPSTPVTAPPAPPPASGTPLSIQLTRTHGQFATFKVVYSHHKFRMFNVQAPKPTSNTGTIFGKVFALIGVQDGEATVQIGDGTPFDLTKGVSHVV
ncbi:MAG TPA: hypothetical protein VHV79_07790 [Mycobacteriales bacterium]|nr:hypothetical protein [Mycobacteriales bacterium]